MLRTIFSLLMLSISLTTFAQIKLPAPSPSIEITQRIGLTTAQLSYSRPSLNGRVLLGQEGILAHGKKWRTGANATTKIAFSNDIEMDNYQLPKGTYALLSTPEEQTWTFHFYPYEQLPYTSFIEKKPIFEITLPIHKLDYSLETLSLHFENTTLNSAHLVLQWANYKVEIPIQVNEHQSILANIEKTLKGPSNFDYFQAALYLHETQTELPLALTYIQKVTQNDAALFFQVYREALILRDLNKKDAAIKAAKRAMELAQKTGNDDFVRLNQQLIRKLSK